MKIAVVVFGYSVSPKGRLHKESILRLRKGTELFMRKRADSIISSGGFGWWFNKTKKPLAWHARKYLVSLGINGSRIHGSRTTNTREEIAYAKKFAEKHGILKLFFVSSKYHIPRIKKICKYIFSQKYFLHFVGIKIKPSVYFTPSQEKKYWAVDKEWLEKHGFHRQR
jgi:uncharacterized SAM-binding protein YcdF (DUF218 family)